MLLRHSHSSEIAALVSSITSCKMFFAVKGEVNLFHFDLKPSCHLLAGRARTHRRNAEYGGWMRGLAFSTLPVPLQLFVFMNAEYLHSKTQQINFCPVVPCRDKVFASFVLKNLRFL